VWFSESHLVLIISVLLVVLFAQFIVDKMKKKAVLYPVKQPNHIFIKTTQSLYSLTHSIPNSQKYVRDLLPYWTASFRYQLLIQLNNQTIFYQNKTVTVLPHSLTPSLTPPIRDLLPYWTASFRYQLLIQ